MATILTEVYETFLAKVSDYSFLNITEEELEEDMFGYLKTARTKFYKCKSDLSIIDDIATGERAFKDDLHPFEIEVLATLMTVEYLKPQILASEVLKQSLSDKDFKIYSQANQLSQLNLTYKMFRGEAKKLITEYTYLDLLKKDDKQ
ncbi:hypothetical protein AB3N02_22520 [Priestia aryabhattai]|uniref:hypothetical protein n=1 Tax=Priestia aryabhattai TaxID=412384 RepID=UPI0039A3246A